MLSTKFDAMRVNWADERSTKVLFLAHCLLNENTRYLGGAFCGGVNHEVLDLLKNSNVGVVQTICPERVAWGGVYKKKVFPLPGIGRFGPIYRFCALCLPGFMFWLNWKMRWVARYTACEIEDYVRNGMTVVGFVGVAGSPACGVTRAPDLKEYFAWSSRVDAGNVSREQHNAVIEGVTRRGAGAFVKYLRRYLGRKRISIPFFEYDLWDEMHGRKNAVIEELRAHLAAEGLYKESRETT